MSQTRQHEKASFPLRQAERLGRRVLQQKDKAGRFLLETGNLSQFIASFFRETIHVAAESREWMRQCFRIGNKSLFLVVVAGTIMGLVLTIQSRPFMVDFAAEAMLPGMVAVSLIREIGPVITALLCAGKISSAMAAELGSMKVTEQIDAMIVSAVHPMRYLVVTRVLAATLMLPLLVLFADASGLMGSWFAVNLRGDISFSLFFARVFRSIEFIDFLPAFIKTFLFGAVIGLIGCYKGMNAGRGTESVGSAANEAVVTASLFIIVVDMMAVQVTDMFYA
jgi:phospholipid/cholesterol/gamma-HCH transport system permease protein